MAISRCYIRKGIFTIEEVLAKTEMHKRNHFVTWNGLSANMSSLRYRNFKEHGIVCVDCGIVGQYFALEKHKNSSQRNDEYDPYHFNLYAVNKDGSEILMTKDHIIPKSKGGRDHLDNFQTMCTRCNCRKGNGDPKPDPKVKGKRARAKELKALKIYPLDKWEDNIRGFVGHIFSIRVSKKDDKIKELVKILVRTPTFILYEGYLKTVEELCKTKHNRRKFHNLHNHLLQTNKKYQYMWKRLMEFSKQKEEIRDATT